MTEPLHVLVYGSTSAGVCDFYRLGMYAERLARLGVEMRTWSDFNDYTVRVPAEYADRLEDAVRLGLAQIDRAPIDWADVILFRRWYSIAPCCEECDTTGSVDFVSAHCQATGHRQNTPDQLLPLLLSTIEAHPESLRGRAIVYETDDDLLAGPSWLPFYNRLAPDRPIVEWMLRHADLVTVTTPLLAKMARRHNDAVRVVRNAVDPAWYAGAAPLENLEGDPRILYYGTASRQRDYGVCREQVDQIARSVPGVRRVWLGAVQETVNGLVDEAHPYVEGVIEFAHSLVSVRPDIGLAPVVGDDFDRAHSELHWLEYSMAGAATIATRTMGGGPYDVIRDGVDGILARNKEEWRGGLRRLVASRTFRDELAGRARERVLAEYNPDDRAAEWADAFRWAAEHGGRGALPRTRAAIAAGTATGGTAALNPLAERTAAESADALAHRQRTRRESSEAVEQLARARAGRDVCWPAGADDHPLVSVTIPTYNRGAILVERAIASALAQTYDNLEVIVVGDCATPETVEVMQAVHDPRVRFENLAVRGPRPPEPERAWQTSGSRPYNRTIDLARGQWIAPHADDDEFTPDHIETLLAAAVEKRLEFVYGASWMEREDGTWFRLGVWPPQHAGFAAGSVLYSTGLRFFKYDEECWREDEPNDWNLWRRMKEAGVTMGFVDHIVFRHYAEARHRAKADVAAGSDR
jgi:Glycosyl transferase family 2/Glycosyl transferases group 1